MMRAVPPAPARPQFTRSQGLCPVMTDPTQTAPETATLELTREDANLILEALTMLLNSRRFAFKEPHENVRDTHAATFESCERIEAALRATFPRR